MTEWVRFNQASWHIASGISRTTGKAITLCGKQADGPTSETYPANERSCESCYRAQSRREAKREGVTA